MQLHVNMLTLIGLIGVTIIIAAGSIFEGLREWLQKFVHRWNPLPVIGRMISCTMCTGWWVGFGWALREHYPVIECIIFGGLVSILSYGTDELLALSAALTHRVIRGAGQQQQRRVVQPTPQSKPSPSFLEEEEEV